MSDVAIFMFDRTGNMAKPWAAVGYECYCIDTQHSIRRPRVEGNITFLWGDARSCIPPIALAKRIAFFACFSPCTHVANSGARDFETKGGMMLVDAVSLFTAGRVAAAWSGAPYQCENPIGVMPGLPIPHIGKPDHYFHPYEYSGYSPSDWYTKQTAIWKGNGFVMPAPFYDAERFARGKAQRAEKLRLKDKAYPTPDWPDDRIHKATPGEERGDVRSETPMGYSIAAFLANASKEAVARYLALNPLLNCEAEDLV